jgi:hypothetical protein
MQNVKGQLINKADTHAPTTVQIADMFFRFFIAITFKQTTRLRSINIPKT